MIKTEEVKNSKVFFLLKEKDTNRYLVTVPDITTIFKLKELTDPLVDAEVFDGEETLEVILKHCYGINMEMIPVVINTTKAFVGLTKQGET